VKPAYELFKEAAMAEDEDRANPEKALIEEAIRLAAAAVEDSSSTERRAMEELALQKLRQVQRSRKRGNQSAANN
jgi:hypothetical protein